MEFLDFSNPDKVSEYEAFVSSMGGSFMQSVRWCLVKRDWIHEALIVRDRRGRILGTMLVLVKKFPAPFRSFLYAPRGPVCDYQDIEVIQELMEGVKRLSKKYKAYSFKADPLIEETDSSRIFAMRAAGLSFLPGMPDERTIQSRNNYILELEGRSEEELLASFKSKCRYNIGLARRKGVPCWYDPNHPNYGVYRFKTGFNGRLAIYAGEFRMTFSEHYKSAFDWVLKRVGYQKLA